MELFLHLFAPGQKLPTNAIQGTLDHEGLDWGWAFLAFVVLAAAVAWSYRRYAPRLSPVQRWGLVSLRSVLLGLLLLLLVHPILLITLADSARRPLLVLLDTTQSMGLVDQRRAPDDLARAAIARGLIDPDGGLKQAPPEPAPANIQAISRRDLLEAVAGNLRLNLWPRLQARASLMFYGFGRKLSPLGQLPPQDDAAATLTPADSAAFFRGIKDDDDETALGDGLRDLLDQERGQPNSGILLITDGASNTGYPPLDAAAIARQDGVPLFIYGVGITSPRDIFVSQIDAPQIGNVKEKLMVTVHVRAQDMAGRQSKIQLKANGKVVDEQPIAFHADGEQDVAMEYTPPQVGLDNLEATVPPFPEEAVQDNNTARTQVRIVDDKTKVLLVENEPTWDFEYLLSYLQRDPHIEVKCVLTKGDPGLSAAPDSPFLDQIPSDKATLFANDLVIIGDVDPADLGDARMKLLNEWVNKMGGGILFLAGPKFDPNAYQNTPLEPMLPVEPLGSATEPAKVYDDAVPLKLTPDGEVSPLLTLSSDPQKNLALWGGFAGVRWTANAGPPRAGAEVLLIDPTASRATRAGPLPVLAREQYGLGESVYLGTNETYRWRSHVGEKYYAQIWGQMIRALTSQHAQGGVLTQLRTDRTNYLTGDRIKISGHIFQPGYLPLTDADVPGTMTIKPDATPEAGTPPPQSLPLHLRAVADRPGEYEGESTALAAGSYSFSTTRDPSVAVKFEVTRPRTELADIAMNEKLLRAMATASGGRFLREEDLHDLPDLITAKMADSVTFKKIPLAFAPVILVTMILVACAEWLWRRRLELK